MVAVSAARLLLDLHGHPIPQHYNPISGTFEHSIGDDYAQAVIPYTEAIAMGLIVGHEEFGGFGDRAGITAVVGGNDVWGGGPQSVQSQIKRSASSLR